MHRQYGDFVRMGPNQISIVNLDVFNKIHGPQTRCSKKHAGTYDINRFRGEYNLDTLTDNALHRDRRKVWDQALNTKSLEGYESTTRAVIHDWLGRLDEVQGLPIDTSLYAKLIPFDNMGRVGFSTDFATVKEGREDRMLRMIEISFDVVARMGLVPWPLAFSQDLPRMGLQKEFEELAVRMTDMRIQADSEDKHDIMKFFLEDLHSEKPKTLKNINAVYADAAAVLIGATDTIACALGFLFYYLARDADLRQRLYDAIAPAYGKRTPGEFACIDLQAIEFLDAVINETLRMNTSVPINGPRNTPPEGVEVDGTYIPGNVSVYTPLHLYHRSPKYFVQPDEFIPERWTTRPELVLERRAFQPFHFGRYDCVGKRLARNVIRLTAAYTLWHYDFAFAPGEDGKDFESRAQWKAIVKPGKLECVFRKRER
ncbi:cytochrome P450 [Sodiomyces alkalinus F11]|uniref:Cytochrome P450 n=1 Tax=Sodiomyces alkalinus (strain CBS 110278 / VKM F-3762 / F11) TaxID=1314773 RepID=A0A3N2PQE9_SODAK|nr:cytochrome P450 [Sodiomyces alkalinus F11]ROT36739.1 cytochrome P450 [Sodiomyces alkalinus F11]